jgi:hypothetical protein
MSTPPALRALVLDVDGTLLTSEHRLTPASRAAVAAREAGLLVIWPPLGGPARCPRSWTRSSSTGLSCRTGAD